MSTAARPRRLPRLRRLLGLATDNWLARIYLAVLAVSVLVMFLFPENAVAASPLLLTAPLSLVGVVLPFGPGTEGGGVVEVLAGGCWVAWLLLCALVNAAALGSLAARSATAEAPGARESLPPVPEPSEPAARGMAGSAPARLRGVRALLMPAVDNWLARGYLAVAAASLGSFLYAVYGSQDPGFAAIWPLLATAPLSILALLVATPVEYSSLSWLSPLIFCAGVAVSALCNAVLLGLLARGLRTRRPRSAD
ncbi:hypothetical protein ABZ484_07405 [Streptomyces sp. NPDC006393]|uniref:SCO4225 family membrane protein n=1 Tax=Streptomyces sp. NPDC006393 TaxID=3156763 RepID=UPI0033D88139